jgi:hypothetical protein
MIMDILELVSILKKNSKIIYEVIYNLKREKEDDILKELIKQVYKNRFDIKKDTVKESFIRNITIYSLVLTLNEQERKEILQKLNILKNLCMNQEEEIYEIIKNNYDNLDLVKELKVPIDLEETIEKYFYDMKKERSKKYVRFIFLVVTISIFISFIIFSQSTYSITTFENVFNSIYNNLCQDNSY